MALKFSFRGETRRFPAGDLKGLLEDYEGVRVVVKQELDLLSGFRFEYTDCDGDVVTVRTQGEWVEALSCQADQTPKFEVIGNKNPAAPVPPQAPPSGPIVVCGLPIRGIETGPPPGGYQAPFPPAPPVAPLPANLADQEREAAALNKRAVALIKGKHVQQAIELLEKCVARFPGHCYTWYNLACALSLVKRTDEAVNALKKAKDHGFGNLQLAAKDADLDNLRELPGFVDWLLSFRPVRSEPLTGDPIFSAYVTKAKKWSRYTWGSAMLAGVGRLGINFAPLSQDALVAGAACAAASGCPELALQALLGGQAAQRGPTDPRAAIRAAVLSAPELGLLADSQGYKELMGVRCAPAAQGPLFDVPTHTPAPPAAEGRRFPHALAPAIDPPADLPLPEEEDYASLYDKCTDLTDDVVSINSEEEEEEEEEEVVPECELAPPAPEQCGVEGRGFEYAQEFAMVREMGIAVPDELLRETLRRHSGDLEAVTAHLCERGAKC